MSRKGNCYDNAFVESWLKTVKAVLGFRFNNHAHAIEIFSPTDPV
jgi:transposase InsO family protein